MKNMKSFLVTFAGVSFVICVALFVFVSAIASIGRDSRLQGTPNVSLIQTRVAQTFVAPYTQSAIPSMTSTPDMLTCGSIYVILNSYRDKLTWDQYHLEGGEVDLYIKSLVGKEISFQGTVNDVVGDTVFINDDSCNNRIAVSGIPEDKSILLAKDSGISGYGTVGAFLPYEIIHVDVETYESGE